MKVTRISTAFFFLVSLIILVLAIKAFIGIDTSLALTLNLPMLMVVLFLSVVAGLSSYLGWFSFKTDHHAFILDDKIVGDIGLMLSTGLICLSVIALAAVDLSLPWVAFYPKLLLGCCGLVGASFFMYMGIENFKESF